MNEENDKNVATAEEKVETVEEVKEETVPEETVTEEPKKEEKVEKPKKEREEGKTKKIISRVLNVLLWIVLLAWMALVVTDYIHVHNEEEPKFCWFNEKTTNYNDGTVTECTGLGYKVIKYNRTSFKALEFGPFWIEDRTAENNK